MGEHRCKGDVARLDWPCTVGALERVLLDVFPVAWAESWDHVGLSVGNPLARVEKVAVALDATADNVARAVEAGANVLVTHHPVCLDMPRSIAPRSSGAPLASACLWEAVSLGVACIAMHTNLDRSPRATGRLPRMLGLDPRCGIELGRDDRSGRLGSVADLGEGVRLDELAQRCRAAFGRVAQVYGNGSSLVHRAAFFTGSLGSCGEDALAAGADVVVCGECGYHRALDLLERGCAVIIVGHDASEAPLADLLSEELAACGVPEGFCVRLDDPRAWHELGAGGPTNDGGVPLGALGWE